MAESRLREIEGWLRRRIQAMIDLSRVPAGGTTGQVVTKTATGYEWATPASGSLTDGDKGDITVSGGGATWNIDALAVGTPEIAADAVTYAKLQNVSAADRLLGRGNGGGAGDAQELTLGTNLSLTGTTLNAASGGGNSLTVTVSFGGSFTDKAQAVVTGQAWVATTTELVAQIKTPSGTDPDEMRLLGMRVEISDLVAATGFTVTAYSEAEARGDYDIMCVGV